MKKENKMKISNVELRRVIRSVISETMDLNNPNKNIPEMMPKRDMYDFMQRARACINLNKGTLFDICANICDISSKNDDEREKLAKHCAKLCMCVCNNDVEGCCSCLSEICSCPKCDQTFIYYCGC